MSVIIIALLSNGKRLQFILDPLRRDASPLNVEVTSSLFSSGLTLLTSTCTPNVRRLGLIGVRVSGKGSVESYSENIAKSLIDSPSQSRYVKGRTSECEPSRAFEGADKENIGRAICMRE